MGNVSDIFINSTITSDLNETISNLTTTVATTLAPSERFQSAASEYFK